MFEDVLVRGDEKTGCTAGGVKDGFVFLRVHHRNDEINNMTRGAKLSGVALRTENVEQMFVGVS